MSKPTAMLEAGSIRESLNECPECGGTDLFFDRERGEVVCRSCGLVIDENVLDMGPEWRSFTPEERETRTRVGIPAVLSVHDKGLSTNIGPNGRDAHGQKLTTEAKIQYYRLRKRQAKSRIQDSADRNLSQAMSDLARFSDSLSAPSSVREQAAALYRKALERGLVRGRSIRSMTAACLYAALRISTLPRSLSEVSGTCRVKKKELARCYRLIVRELGLSMPRTNTLTFISKIAQRAGVSNRVVEAAVKVLREADEKYASLGKDPRSLAAAALYTASRMVGENVTQKEIAYAANVTEVTVRNHFKGLCRVLGIKVPHRKGG